MQNKNTTAIIIILLVVILGVLIFIAAKKPSTNSDYQIPVGDTANEKDTEDSYTNIEDEEIESESTTYTYENHGFTMELPIGYVPTEFEGETGPTWSIELPDGWLIYITDATWWERYNLVGQADYIRSQKIGTTTFKVYKYTGQTAEFYYFRQGNVAYMFNGDVIEHMTTFKFVGWN